MGGACRLSIAGFHGLIVGGGPGLRGGRLVGTRLVRWGEVVTMVGLSQRRRGAWQQAMN